MLEPMVIENPILITVIKYLFHNSNTNYKQKWLLALCIGNISSRLHSGNSIHISILNFSVSYQMPLIVRSQFNIKVFQV